LQNAPFGPAAIEERVQSALFREAAGQNALFGHAVIEERLQNAVFREAPAAECTFP
jgi:hypothetical protein